MDMHIKQTVYLKNTFVLAFICEQRGEKVKREKESLKSRIIL